MFLRIYQDDFIPRDRQQDVLLTAGFRVQQPAMTYLQVEITCTGTPPGRHAILEPHSSMPSLRSIFLARAFPAVVVLM